MTGYFAVLVRLKWLLLPISLLPFVLFLNMVTINDFPSWWDEAFMANISFNLSAGRGLFLDLNPSQVGSLNLYGPVFFYLQSFLIGITGFDAFWYRLPNLMAAYFTMILLALILRCYGINRAYASIFLLLVLVDFSINRNIISGRMDMVAVLFAVSAFYVATLFARKLGWRILLKWWLVGTLCAAAFLTTPRTLFLLPGVLVITVHQLFYGSSYPLSWKAYTSLAALSGFALPLYFWIQHVGGVVEYFQLYTTGNTTSNIAPSLFRHMMDTPAILLLLMLAVTNLKRIVHNPLPLSLLLTFISFSLFVKEAGPYSGMIMPFVLALIVYLIAQINIADKKKYAVLLFLAVPGLLQLGLRWVDYQVNAECRDGSVVQTTLDRVGLDGQSIVAPYKYYFFVEGIGRDTASFWGSMGGFRPTWRESPHLQVSVERATVVIAEPEERNWLNDQGFQEVASLECSATRIPGLPGNFPSWFVFNELVFKRKSAD